jgi:hypothetical protein
MPRKLLPIALMAAVLSLSASTCAEEANNGPAPAAYPGKGFPTPYVATLSKTLPTGNVTIKGNSSATAQGAVDNLMRAWREYTESGSWGGPG